MVKKGSFGMRCCSDALARWARLVGDAFGPQYSLAIKRLSWLCTNYGFSIMCEHVQEGGESRSQGV